MKPNSCLRPGATALAALVAGVAAFDADPAAAHGFAGKRFFPATITNDDPFVADELPPTASWFKNGERPAEGETDARSSSPSASSTTRPVARGHLDPPRSPRRAEQERFPEPGDLAQVPVLYQRRARSHRLAGLGVEWGDTGARKVGAESSSALQPTLFFGKGAGDLPDDVGLLKPFAVTGLVRYAIPTDGRHTSREVDDDTGELEREVEKHAQSLVYGFSLEYSLPYLQANVRDLGWGRLHPPDPAVEFAFETPVQHGQGAGTTASSIPASCGRARAFRSASRRSSRSPATPAPASA